MIRRTPRPTDRRYTVYLLLLLGAAFLTACGVPAAPEPTATLDPPTATVPPSPTPLPTPTPTATPVPPKELTICQAQEPNTLFIYGGPSRAARNVLDAVYDGPIDSRNYTLEPVILERVPSLKEGDAELLTVFVGEGDRVVDAAGQVVELTADATVENAEGGEVIFAGDVISMTQLVVTFTLRSDVTWADGQPLDAEDSWFSYELASQVEDPALQRRLERTASYEVENDRTVVWRGVPGYVDTYYQLNFFHPLPQHVLGGTDVARLLETDVARHRPLGWGPYVVESWTPGESIGLVRNPHYFRAAEGLPHLDRVIYRFIRDPEEAVEELLAGRCDVVTEDLMDAGGLPILAEVADGQGVELVSASSSEWEHLDFGIQPARWSGRVSRFDERRARHGVARCIDRSRVAAEAFPLREALVADSYVPADHPLYAGDDLHRWAYDPAAGRAALEEAGWADGDGDGLLEAQDVPGVAQGTVFSVTLLTTEGDPARQRAAEVLKADLAVCGVGLTVEYLRPEVFYADGPDGPVFGRQFDLALFSWLNGLGAPCELYMSGQIPQEENWWATSNNPGYASEIYDRTCRSAVEAPYGTVDHLSFHLQAQSIFSSDLPVLPLYFVPKSVGVRQEVAGLTLDSSQQTPFWNIESIDVVR
jgi:peptide/nickel transport system substrate-binding protein